MYLRSTNSTLSKTSKTGKSPTKSVSISKLKSFDSKFWLKTTRYWIVRSKSQVSKLSLDIKNSKLKELMSRKHYKMMHKELFKPNLIEKKSNVTSSEIRSLAWRKK